MSRPLTREEYDALPEVLTADEAARILDTTGVQVRLWAAEGRVPGMQIGRMWRFSKKQLERFIEEDGQPGTL
jgi:excisionase family DNA binding protein